MMSKHTFPRPELRTTSSTLAIHVREDLGSKASATRNAGLLGPAVKRSPQSSRAIACSTGPIPFGNMVLEEDSCLLRVMLDLVHELDLLRE